MVQNAWALLDAGYSVTIISEKWASLEDRITSQIAGALYVFVTREILLLPFLMFWSRWEYPPAVCGKHTDVISLQKSKGWCMTSYRAFDKLQKLFPDQSEEPHGIRMRMANFFFDHPIEEIPDEYEKMLEIESSGVSFAPKPQQTPANSILLRSEDSSETQRLYSSMR